MAAQSVQKLLDAVQHQEQLDDELLDYICCIMADPDPESSLDVLQELLAGAVKAFGSKSSEQQTALVLKLLDDAKACGTTQPSISSPSRNSLEAVVAVFKQATIHSQQPACADVTNTLGSDTSNCKASKPMSDSLHQQDLSPLLALSPQGITKQYVAHILQHVFSGNIQQAADWLLECPDLLQKQQAWEEQQSEQEQQRQEQEQLKQQAKKQIVERFDLQVVPNGPLKPKHGVDVLPAAKKGEQPQGKVRYRDGKVVSCKGEKYIVEKLGEEWDGGSKGKVYTKGKRGVGYR